MDCPSSTAWGVAVQRARHQILDQGAIFHDPLAVRILGPQAEARLSTEDSSGERHFRNFIAIRSRIVEDKLALAVQRGTKQTVILGGGLDTLGLRNPHHQSGLRIVEVDKPEMQSWKKRQLHDVGIVPPESLQYVPVDLEQDLLETRLAEAGFDASRPAFFSWLGVTPYLTRDAILKTLQMVACIPNSGIVFDYGEPARNHIGPARQLMEARARRVAAVGEPWLSRFDPSEMADLLKEAGFAQYTDMNRAGMAFYFGWPRPENADQASGHVIHAWSGDTPSEEPVL